MFHNNSQKFQDNAATTKSNDAYNWWFKKYPKHLLLNETHTHKTTATTKIQKQPNKETQQNKKPKKHFQGLPDGLLKPV